MPLNEPQFMSFDFAGTPKANWPADLTADQKSRLGADLTVFDVPILKADGKDALQHLGVPITQADIDNFTFRYWFNYFSEEAAVSSDKADVAGMAAALNGVLRRKRFPIPSKSKFVTGEAKATDYYELRPPSDTARCDALTGLLKIGFTGMRRFIGPLPEKMANLPFMEEVLTDDTRLFTRGEGQTAGFVREVYWRGESRTPEQLLAQATKRAVDIPYLVAKMNMDKGWNPFSKAEIAANIWYRKSKNKDNDYYTAISVALDFKTACCFPLIDERRVYQFPAGPTGLPEFDPWNWKAADRQKNIDLLGVVRAVGLAKPRVQVVTKTIVYLSTNRGAKVFTRAAQEKVSKTSPFPEHGVAEIAPEDIYGYLVVYRAFHGLGKQDGFTAFIDKAASSRVRYDGARKQMERVAAADAGRDLLQYGDIHQRLEAEYTTALNSPPFAVAWAGGGHAGRDVLISALVEKPPLTGSARGFLMNGMKKPSSYA